MVRKFLFGFIFLITIGTFSIQAQGFISQDSLKTLHGLSLDYAYDYKYKDAMDVSDLMINLAKGTNDDYYTSLGYSRLGSVHNYLGDTIKSREYYNKALLYAQKTKLDTFVSGIYNDIGNIYVDNGGSEALAITYYKKSIELNERGNGPELNVLAAFMNIGWTYLDQKNPGAAFSYINKSQKLIDSKEGMHPLYQLNLDILFGRYHFYRNDVEKAKGLLVASLEQAESSNFLDQLSDAALYLSQIAEKEGKDDEALTYFKKHKEIDDKLDRINREQSVLEASARLTLEQYQNDLAQAENEKSLSSKLADKSKQLSNIFILVSIVLFVVLITFFELFRNRRRYINELNEKNQELYEAKENAERLSKLKTQFFSTVSHELRTPLYGVIGLSSILLEDEKLTSHKDDLKSLKFSANYLLALINDVLTLNKVEANGMKLEKTPFRLRLLVKNITDSFTFSLQQNNNKIQVVIDESIPARLMGDSVKLSQILMNLVGNAIKFNENGTIEIIVKLLEEKSNGNYTLQFFIKDNGIGIPEEKQASIFEEFSQVENNNYNYQGTGLGLPIVKKLLNLHDSKIALTSEVGNGSIFSFILDFEGVQNQIEIVDQDVVPIEKTGKIPSFGDIHILIVDDNKINQKVTQKILETRNFKTSLADDGLQAISMTQQNDYSLILMDIHMPNMGGVEATENIRTFDKQIPIIALTAVEIEEAKSQIMAAGMNDIILKPYDVSQFLTTILRNYKPVFADR